VENHPSDPRAARSETTCLLHDDQCEPATVFRAARSAPVAPGPDGGGRVVVDGDDAPAPVVWAGPILRQVSESSVMVWLATSEAVDMRVKLYEHGRGGWTQIAVGDFTAPARIGARLYSNYAKVVRPGLRRGVLYGYDVELRAQEGWAFSHGHGVVANAMVTYDGAPFPTFVIGHEGRRLEVMHASCRKIHAPEPDAMLSMDQHLASVANGVAHRPSMLLLTGDQIYADDVSIELIGGIMKAAELLLGFPEYAPGHGRTSQIRPGTGEGQRYSLLHGAGFSVDAEVGGQHLMSFGEYAAMYLLTWSPVLWVWGPLRDMLAIPLRTHIREILGGRRVLANVPTYMIMDDHEVTDDYPLHLRQDATIGGSPLGRWVIANAHAAYAEFQLRGNDPAKAGAIHRELVSYVDAGMPMPDPLFASEFEPTPEERTAYETRRDAYASRVIAVKGLSFTTPISPRVVFMDTRTRRALHEEERCPGLLDWTGLSEVRAMIQGLRSEAPAPLLVVSPPPLYNLAALEAYQRHEAANPVPDPEPWCGDADAFAEIHRIFFDAGRAAVVSFSGDVHYGYVCTAPFRGAHESMTVVQLTSSGVKNHPSENQQRVLSTAGHPSVMRSLGLPGAAIDALVEAGDAQFHTMGRFGFFYTHTNFGFATITWDADGATHVHHTLKGHAGEAPVTIDVPARTHT
jgi:hypothetical protein